MNIFFIFSSFIFTRAGLHDPNSSDKLFERDENGECAFPPFCNLDVERCNVDRIPLHDFNGKYFLKHYYRKQEPVIIQLCPDLSQYPECLSSMIDNSTGVFQWDDIILQVRGQEDYKNLQDLEFNGSPFEREKTLDIHPLKDNEPKIYKEIIDRIKPLRVLERIDIFNDIASFIGKNGDDPQMGNKWVIFGTAGGGARFHFDYFLSSFWNFALQGSKFWVLVPPYDALSIWQSENTDAEIQKVMALTVNEFFSNIYLSGFLDRRSKATKKTYFYCKQNPGDIVFAPSIYYHATVNLERTLNVARNLITRMNYQNSFNFITQPMSLQSSESKGRWVGVWHAMLMCCGLKKVRPKWFKQCACGTVDFKTRLDSMPSIQWNSTLSDIITSPVQLNSEIYDELCLYAESVSTWSSFRKTSDLKCPVR